MGRENGRPSLVIADQQSGFECPLSLCLIQNVLEQLMGQNGQGGLNSTGSDNNIRQRTKSKLIKNIL